MTTSTRKFSLGQVVATPGALEALQESGQAPLELIVRHAHGDWGELCDEDRQMNEQALEDGGRLMSAYTLQTGVKIWAFTEAADEDGQRSATSLILPIEY